MKGDSAFLFVGSVADNAVFLEEWMDLIGKAIGQGGSKAAEKKKNGSEVVNFCNCALCVSHEMQKCDAVDAE